MKRISDVVVKWKTTWMRWNAPYHLPPGCEGDIPTKLVFRLLGRFGEYGLDLPIHRQDPLIRVGMARPAVIGWEKKGLKHVPVFDLVPTTEPYPEVEMDLADFRCKCGTCEACATEKLLSEEDTCPKEMA